MWFVLAGIALVPVAALVVIVRKLVRARTQSKRRIAAWRAMMEQGAALRCGPASLEARVVGEPRTYTSLGTSLEAPSESGMTSRPTLTSEELVVETVDGKHLRIDRGTRVRILELPGARRRILDMITCAEGGVVERVSFEVTPEHALWFCGALDTPGDAPFRGSIARLLPVDGEVTVASSPPQLDLPSRGWAMALAPALLVLLVFASEAPTDSIPFAIGWLLLTLISVIATILALFADFVRVTAPPASAIRIDQSDQSDLAIASPRP